MSKTENMMPLSFIKERIKVRFINRHNYKDEFENKKAPTPILMIGERGLGKTETVEALVPELRMELKDETIGFRCPALTAMEPGEILGLPKTDPVTGKTVYSIPRWWPVKGDGTKGIMLLNEINRADREVMACLLSVVKERRLGDAELSDEWIIVADMNPSSGESCTYDVNELDPAFVGRFSVWGVAPDRTGFLNWMEKKYGPESLAYQFAVADKDAVKFDGNQGNPRDYERLHLNLAMELGYGKLDTGSIRSIVAADIGNNLAASFINFYELREYCTPDMVLFDDWANCKNGLGKIQADKTFNVTMALMKAVPAVFLKTKDTPEKKVNLDNLVKFLEFLGPEKSFACVQVMLNLDRQSKDYQGDKIKKLLEHARDTKSQIVDWLKTIMPKVKK